MHFLRAFLKTEAHAELPVQGFFVVAHHIEAAAFGGSFRAEGTDNYMAPRPDRSGDLLDIGRALFRSS
jgi:hypothetical protein